MTISFSLNHSCVVACLAYVWSFYNLILQIIKNNPITKLYVC
jgi:hypothetical protein